MLPGSKVLDSEVLVALEVSWVDWGVASLELLLAPCVAESGDSAAGAAASFVVVLGDP